MLEKILEGGFREFGLTPPEGALWKFRRYCGILEEKNRVMDLTAIIGEKNIAELHFLDCAALLTKMPPDVVKIIDVGSGAGFPGVPMKILRPELEMTLLDAQRKRQEFLKELLPELKLEGVTLQNSRAEESAKSSAYRERYDAAVSRAVARLNMLCELCLPFVRVGGVFIAMKGPDCEEEAEEAGRVAALLGGGELRVYGYEIPGTQVRRSLVCIDKIAPTPVKYPRRFASIKNSPL